MGTNKEASFKKIDKEFLKISNLTIEQLVILEQILALKEPAISIETIKKLDKNEKDINKLDLKLDEHIIKAIVLYQPLASELRNLFAIYKIVQNLERIADRVIKIVHLKQKIKDVALYFHIIPKLNKVVEQTIAMVTNSINSIKMSDKEVAFLVLREELMFDTLNRDLMKTAIKEIEKQVELESLLLSMTEIRSILSSLDRIGDHSKNIAEASLYSLIGKNYMHQKIDENPI